MVIPMNRVLAVAFALGAAACGHEARVAPVVAAAAPPQAPASMSASPPVPSTEDARVERDAADYMVVLGRRSEGSAVMREALLAYVASHPSSAKIGDALFALGDLELADDDRGPDKLALAKTYFEGAVRTLPSDSATQAWYALARVHVLSGNYKEAARAFDLGRSTPGQRDSDGAQRSRALADLLIAFVEGGTPTEAHSFFPELTRSEYEVRDMLARLAAAYEDLGKYAEGRAVYDDLRHRDVQNSCVWTVRYRHASPTADGATLEADLAKCRR